MNTNHGDTDPMNNPNDPQTIPEGTGPAQRGLKIAETVKAPPAKPEAPEGFRSIGTMTVEEASKKHASVVVDGTLYRLGYHLADSPEVRCWGRHFGKTFPVGTEVEAFIRAGVMSKEVSICEVITEKVEEMFDDHGVCQVQMTGPGYYERTGGAEKWIEDLTRETLEILGFAPDADPVLTVSTLGYVEDAVELEVDAIREAVETADDGGIATYAEGPDGD